MLFYKVLRPGNKPTLNEFIEFWASHYDYKEDQLHKYTNNIHRKTFASQNVQELFEWKNGIVLSGNKQKTVNHIKKRINTVNALKKDFDDSLFDENFGKISLVWRIFLLHIIDPKSFPLYDQHIHRAYSYLTNGNVPKEKNTVAEKLSFYKDEYIGFFNTLCKDARLSKKEKVDDALWSFGKFLSRYPKMITQ